MSRLFWGTDTYFVIEPDQYASDYVPCAVVRVARKQWANNLLGFEI